MSKDQKRQVHDLISGENYSYHEIKDIARTLFNNRMMITPVSNEVINDFMPINKYNLQKRIDSGYYDL